ncbi:MAG TPA: hypothetical protein VF748_12055 [Candidatus Acidoferrum sp.]
MKLKRTTVATAYFAATLLLTSVRTANGQEKKPSSEPARLAETETSGDSPTARRDGPAPETKKRGRWHSWLRMAAEAQANQPDWLSPLATTSGRLKQELRVDVFDQPSPNGSRTYQFGGGKGLEFITSSRTQVLMGVPSYTLVSPNGPAGGFGDLPVMLKFRIASAERSEGDFLLTFILGATAPSGSHRYGVGDAVLSPTLAFGKGWRRFDVQSTLGANLPAGDTARLGRQLLWNTALQYEAAWKLWPELEVNSTVYKTGPHAGDKQVFLTPGLGLGRVRLGGRFRFSSAAGMQIAATRFHSYNHRWIFSERLSF